MGRRRSTAVAEPASFADRFRARALENCDEICAAIVAKATAGERWAAELVMKYAAQPPASHEPTSGDVLTAVLEDIRERLANGP